MENSEKKEVKKAGRPKKEKVWEPVIMDELSAIKLTEKIKAMPLEKGAKLTIRSLVPADNGKLVKCAKIDALDWIICGVGELVD